MKEKVFPRALPEFVGPFSRSVFLAVLDSSIGLQYNFSKMRGGEGGQRPFEFFPKFIRFGSVTRPLFLIPEKVEP